MPGKSYPFSKPSLKRMPHDFVKPYDTKLVRMDYHILVESG